MKRKSILLKAVLLIAAFNLQFSAFNVVIAQNVQVILRPKMNPEPPQVLNYINNPGQFFNVSLTNTSNETLNVFITIEVEKSTGDLKLTTPYYIQPNQAIPLPAGRLTQLNQGQLISQFRQLNTTDILLQGAEVSDFYGSSIVGLLPEGTYSAQVKVYQWDPAARYPQLLSDPNQGKCTFNVCYSAQAPEITVPNHSTTAMLRDTSTPVSTSSGNTSLITNTRRSMGSKKNTMQNTITPANENTLIMQNTITSASENDIQWDADLVDVNNAMFAWQAPVLNCGGTARQYKYNLSIYPIGPTMTTPEEAVAMGTYALSIRGLLSPQCILTPQQISAMMKYSATGYFVARVTAVPAVTDINNIYYSTIENDGNSQLLVFRFVKMMGNNNLVITDDTRNEEEADDEEEDVEVIIGGEDEEEEELYSEPDENDDREFVYYPPKLTGPAPFVGNVIEADKDLEFKWEKPEMISGPADTLNFNYTVSVFKKNIGQSLDSVLVSKPLFTEKSLSTTEYTLRWNSLSKEVKLNDNLVIAILPICTNENSLAYNNDDRRNIYRGAHVTVNNDNMADCNPTGADHIQNKQLGIFNEKQIREMEVKIGEFTMTITNANLDKEKGVYSGTGYVNWYPMGDGFPLMINVEFDALKINSDKIVYEGSVKSAKEEEKGLSDYIPYDMFDDMGLAALMGEGTAETYGDKLFDYIENNASLKEYCKYAREAAPILDAAINQQLPVNLPVNLSKYIPSSPFDIQILSARFSPTNASIGIVGMFSLPQSRYLDSQIAVFGVPRLCIGPDNFVPEGCTMALLADVTIVDPETQFAFSLKAPTNLSDIEDGCTLSFNKDGFEQLTLEAAMSVPGLLKADAKGDLVRGETPAIDIKANIRDWDDWIGSISMDNFQVEEAPGFTFIPGGKGLVYDHSCTSNSTAFSFPEPVMVKGGLTDGLKGKTYDKTKVGIQDKKDDKLWKGLYLDEIGVLLPPIFEDNGGRVKVSMKQFLYDDSGVSLTIAAGGQQGKDLIGISTGKMGGWSISLHEVGVSVIQNDFGCTYFSGGIQMPLIGGKWNYATSFDKIDKGAGGSDLRILFHVNPAEQPKFDFFLAELALDSAYTHLDVEYLSEAEETKIEFETAGDITIAGTEEVTKKLKVNIPGVEFTGMRIANFEKEEASRNESEVQKMKFSHSFDPICEGPNCWFDLGTWGLASAEKTLGPFRFALDNFGVAHDGGAVGINIVGTIGLLGEVFSATAGVTIWANVDLNSLSISYKETTLDKIGLSTEFGGCKVAGSLEFKDEKKGSTSYKGYAGTLKFTLPGDLIRLEAAGGFFNAKDTKYGEFTSGYFLAELGSATGIQLGVVQLNNIQGGFFFHTSLDMASVEQAEQAGEGPASWKTSVLYGTHGGMFGLGIATPGTDRGMNAKVRMTVLYDATKNRLSTFRMTGDMHALCGPDPEQGLINTKCCIVYQNLSQAEGGKYFQINITSDAGGDMDEMYKQFTGQDFEMPQALADLSEMEDVNKGKKNEAKETKPKISCGAHLSLDFKVTMKPDDYTGSNFKTKWHLYLGEPGDGSYESRMKSRCSLTLIDFMVGSKTGSVGAWCKIWANGYLCVGNELPNGGALPPIPQEIQEYLNGSDVNGKKQSLYDGKAEDEKRSKPFKDIEKSMKTGVMFGVEAGGDFGVNAVICYARATLMAGFDVVLKQLDNAQCNGKPAGGVGGFYGMGQVYGMAKGELGLIINLWIYKGHWPLIDVGLGALLRGGFPNPSWLYGKVRAHCKLFGGLIKFNGSLTLEMGDVCFPDAGNPLDNIKIFEDMTPGEEMTSDQKTPSGWKTSDDERISIYSPAGFTTNMKIGKRLDLVDENTANRMAGKDGDPAEYANNAMRSYKFYLEPTGTIEYWNSSSSTSNPVATENIAYRSGNQETYEYVFANGIMAPEKYCRITQKGYCKEIRNGREVDPVFNDESTGFKDVHKVWRDSVMRYFRTGSLPNNIINDVVFTLPQKADKNRWYLNEMRNPELHLKTNRADDGIFDESKYDLTASFEKEVDGLWIPVDAYFSIDTYTADNGKTFYRVDENGNVDYTTKVDANGYVIDTQCDPFTDKSRDSKGYGYTYDGKEYSCYGVNRERIQRFAVTLGNLMSEAAGIVGTSKAGNYYPLKWVPESFNSIETAIKYYQEYLKVDVRRYSGLTGIQTKLESLSAELQQSMKDYYYPNPNDKDIHYHYQGATSAKDWRDGKQAYNAAASNTEKIQAISTYMERCLNDGPVYSDLAQTNKIADNRHQLDIGSYGAYINTYNNKMNEAASYLRNIFSRAATSTELNDAKQLYLSLSEPYSRIKADYDKAVKISGNVRYVDDYKKYIQETLTPYVRSKNKNAKEKAQYLNLVKENCDKIHRYRTEADSLYAKYCKTKHIGRVDDAMADTLAVLTRYVNNLANNEAISANNDRMEAILNDARNYLTKTSEPQQSLTYVTTNYLSKAQAYLDASAKISNNCEAYERAKELMNALKDLLFSSEKIALEYTTQLVEKAKKAYTLTTSIVSSTLNSTDAETQDSNLAKAYEYANAAADHAADAVKCSARHTGSANTSPRAGLMRTQVSDCQKYADDAMQEYRTGKEKVAQERAKKKVNVARVAATNMVKEAVTVLTSSSNSIRTSAFAKLSAYNKDILMAGKECDLMLDDHIYLTTLWDLGTISDMLTEAVKNVTTTPKSRLNAASKIRSIVTKASAFATSDKASRQDGAYASCMAELAKGLTGCLNTISLSSSATRQQKADLRSYQTQAASALNDAAAAAKSKAQMKLTGRSEAIPADFATPTYALNSRSTVPGVAEACAPADHPDTPDTPDGPTGASLVAKMAGKMNASASPAAPAPPAPTRPSVPAEAVIHTASGMLNSAVAASELPMAPAPPSVPASGSSAYSAAENILNKALTGAGKTTSVSASTKGASAHINMESLKNSTKMAIPVKFHHINNNKEQYLSLRNCDIYNAVENETGKKYNYRIIINQIDRQKWEEFRLKSYKKTETTVESATATGSSKAYLSGTGSDGTGSADGNYNLQAYMANYYKEMETKNLNKNEGEAEKTKLEEQKDVPDEFATQIYEWKFNFKDGIDLWSDFATWAKKNGNVDGSMYSGKQLDNQLEGLRTTNFKYGNASYSPTNLAKMTDKELFSFDYVSKDPYVWTAYMGSYALFNNRTISDYSGYWDTPFPNPKAFEISFPEWTSRFRRNTEPSIGFSNKGSLTRYFFEKNGKVYDVDVDTENGENIESQSWWDEWEPYFTETLAFPKNEGSNFIKNAAIGYSTPTYDACRAINITYDGFLYTSVNAINNMLYNILVVEQNLRDYYNKLYDKKKGVIREIFSQWNTSSEMLGSQIEFPAIQAGFIYEAEWLLYKNKGLKEWKKYFPGYPSRYDREANSFALGFTSVLSMGSVPKVHQFNFKFYKDNLKSVTQQFYRCNCYVIGSANPYSVFSNTTDKYTTEKEWKDPLRDYSQYGLPTVSVVWK